MYQPLSIYILVYTTYLTEAHFDVMSKPYRYIYIYPPIHAFLRPHQELLEKGASTKLKLPPLLDVDVFPGRARKIVGRWSVNW